MILHIDMDAFFASIEQRDNPHLRGKPVVVSGRSMRSVVSTASYEARVFGIRSAMPLAKALELCPEAKVITGRMDQYREASDRIFSIIKKFTPLAERVSIDEVCIDVTGCVRLFGTPLEIAHKIKKEIRSAENLTCSIGIAALRFIAKIASDMNKPDGITMIKNEDTSDFINNLAIQKIPGVGPSTMKIMESMGIKTLGQIRKIDEKILKQKFGIYGAKLKELASGLDRSRVEPLRERKSYSTETTLDHDMLDSDFLTRKLLEQSDELARLLRLDRIKAKTVSIKITYESFRQITRNHTLDRHIQSSEQIYSEALMLFKSERHVEKIRLIGVGVSGFADESKPEQMVLFKDMNEKKHQQWDMAEKAIDSVIDKFGKNSLKRASININTNCRSKK